MQFDTNITPEEWDTIGEAVGMWECSEDAFLDFLGRLERVGDPPQEFIEQAGEGFEEWWHEFKKEMLSRKQISKDRRKDRMEKATFIKTKIILQRRASMDSLTDRLFNSTDDDVPAPKEASPPPKTVKPVAPPSPPPVSGTTPVVKKQPPQQTHGKNNPDPETK